MKKLLNKKGFTLIELIVVIAILAILAMILIPSLTGYIKAATDSKNQANARSEYSRVLLGVTTGGITATAASYAVGTINCSYTVTTGALTKFSCTATDGSLKTYPFGDQ